MSGWEPGQPLYSRRSVHVRYLFELTWPPSDEPDVWRTPGEPSPTDAARWPQPFDWHNLDLFEAHAEEVRRRLYGH